MKKFNKLCLALIFQVLFVCVAVASNFVNSPISITQNQNTLGDFQSLGSFNGTLTSITLLNDNSNNRKILYATDTFTLYRSVDNGGNWDTLTNAPKLITTLRSYNNSSSTVIYAISDAGRFLKASYNKGAKWDTIYSTHGALQDVVQGLDGSIYIIEVASDSSQTNPIILAHVSRDNGKTWNQLGQELYNLYQTNPFSLLAIKGNGPIIYYNNNIYTYTDSIKSWVITESGINSITSMTGNENGVYIASKDHYLYYSDLDNTMAATNTIPASMQFPYINSDGSAKNGVILIGLGLDSTNIYYLENLQGDNKKNK